MRKFNRKNEQTREIVIQKEFSKNSDGSCLVCFGDTKVICTASVDDEAPKWIKDKKSGWITAEYGMLPGSTNSRNRREAKSGKQSGRTVEIQRLIGRSLRSIVDLKELNGFQIIVDCDVLQADGGTRTASITGGFVAMSLAIKKLLSENKIKTNPVKDYIAAISCGIVKGNVLVDLDYIEDSSAQVDANFVMTKNSGFSEIQISGEESTFSSNFIDDMIKKGGQAIRKIFDIQKNALT